MKCIENVRASHFLNNLNWDILSCHDKALCLMAESLKENASLYFIMFKLMGRDYLRRHYDCGIGDQAYYDFIGRRCGIRMERRYGRAGDFLTHMKAAADQGQHCVLMINTRYQKGARLEGKKDHPHFVAYKGYDEEYFYFIDEDWSKQYWRTKDVDEVIYCQRKIDAEELRRMSVNVDTCNIFDRVDAEIPDGKYFMYYLLTKTNDDPCDLSGIKALFLEQLEYLIANNGALMDYTGEKMASFKENLEEYRNKMVLGVRQRLDEDERKADEIAMKEQIANARRDELFAIRTRFIYPCESEIIGGHYFFLCMLKRMLILRICDFNGKARLLEQIQMLLGAYEYVKLQIARSVILGEVGFVERAWDRYTGINKKSLSIYKKLLRESWTFHPVC